MSKEILNSGFELFTKGMMGLALDAVVLIGAIELDGYLTEHGAGSGINMHALPGLLALAVGFHAFYGIYQVGTGGLTMVAGPLFKD
ncbi:MAG: hypothetical protein AAB955_01690 [Patescibacteria group bacterium]